MRRTTDPADSCRDSGKIAIYGETFEKYSVLFKVKPPAQRVYAPKGKTKISTTGILEVFRGSKFEFDAGIEGKMAFCKGLLDGN